MDYNDKYREIFPYVRFNFDRRKNLNKLSPSEKWLITRYYNGLRYVLAREDLINYKPSGKNKKNKLKQVAKTTGIKTPLKQIKKLPIENVWGSDTKIRFIKNKLIIESVFAGQKIRRETVFLDLRILKHGDYAKHIREKFAELSKSPSYIWTIFGNRIAHAGFLDVGGAIALYTNTIQGYLEILSGKYPDYKERYHDAFAMQTINIDTDIDLQRGTLRRSPKRKKNRKRKGRK